MLDVNMAIYNMEGGGKGKRVFSPVIIVHCYVIKLNDRKCRANKRTVLYEI